MDKEMISTFEMQTDFDVGILGSTYQFLFYAVLARLPEPA